MPGPTRQLAAIMFTDIVGYTAMMGKDSAKAMEWVAVSKEIQKPLVEKHHGKWLKEMGDGALAMFSTSMDAVACAVEIQEAARAKFEGKLRIGIHSGDITIENNDVYGDGVNVASRLESIADPGGIFISESIEKAIRGLGSIQTLYLGESQLKNVDYGVRTYAIQGVGLPVPTVKQEKGSSKGVWAEMQQRGVARAGLTYLILSLLILLILIKGEEIILLPAWGFTGLLSLLMLGFPVSVYLAWHYERSPDGFIRTGSERSRRNPFSASEKKPFTGNFMIAGLLIILVILYLLPQSGTKVKSLTGNTGSMGFNKKSIAVLPFKNLSGDEENLYFSDGVMEAILNNLSRIRDLKVVSRTSVEKYRNENKSIREIAGELEVANILEGSVQRVGDQVRITAQLISAENDEHLWADNYDRKLTDIFSVQSEIAQTIADNLEVIITTEELELIREAPTTNLKAYELLLRSRHKSNVTEEDILERIELCKQAIKLDPEFALAYSALGSNLLNLSNYGYPKRIWNDSAYVLAKIANEKDPRAWQPYVLSGVIEYGQRNIPEALFNFKRSIELNPNYGYSNHVLGNYYLTHKEYEKGIDFLLKGVSLEGNAADSDIDSRYGFLLIQFDVEFAYQFFRRSYESNPSEIRLLEQLSNCARYLGDYKKSNEYALEYLRKRPDFVNAKNLVAGTYLVMHDYPMAEKYYREIMEQTSEYQSMFSVYAFIHRLGFTMMKNGKEEEGRQIMETYMDTLQARIDRKEVASLGLGEYYDMGISHAALGHKEEAYKWLRKARDQEKDGAFFRLDFLLSDPMLDNLREDQEFKDMLQAKKEEQAEMKRVFYEKVAIYQANNELKWMQTQ